MPILDSSDYRPKGILRSAHVNTMYPYLFRKKVSPPYRRERFETSDGDFVDLDCIYDGHKRLVILCHGLEGSSESQYMEHVSILLAKSWDVVAFNYRSCSGEVNRKLQMYHSGFTSDLHEITSHFGMMYDKIALVGYSLGGNMILKYTNDGVLSVPDAVKSVVAVSTPADLSKSSAKIISLQNRLYDIRFRQTLIQKMKEKQKQFPEDILSIDLEKVKNLWDFDEYFTGPLHGFAGAEDYYAQCNSLQFLGRNRIPTLMITAQDDPFLTEDSLPFAIADRSDNLYFLAPKFGGHVGFTTFESKNYWNEIKTLQFIHDPVSCANHCGHIPNELQK